MINLAGALDANDHVLMELNQANIFVVLKSPDEMRGEVQTKYKGELLGWEFTRAWYYWVAKSKNGFLKFKYADPLHELIGTEVRVDGHCGCPSPQEQQGPGARERALKNWESDKERGLIEKYNLNPVFEWNDGIDLYHVDSQEGLCMLAATIIKQENDRLYAIKQAADRKAYEEKYGTKYPS